MITKGLIVRLEAKPSKAEELAQFLRDALPLVDDEPETVAWFAVSGDAHAFVIFDVFPDENGRRAHLDGLIAAPPRRAHRRVQRPRWSGPTERRRAYQREEA